MHPFALPVSVLLAAPLLGDLAKAAADTAKALKDAPGDAKAKPNAAR